MQYTVEEEWQLMPNLAIVLVLVEPTVLNHQLGMESRHWPILGTSVFYLHGRAGASMQVRHFAENVLVRA
jgi:hypothetical protein